LYGPGADYMTVAERFETLGVTFARSDGGFLKLCREIDSLLNGLAISRHPAISSAISRHPEFDRLAQASIRLPKPLFEKGLD
jgi:hypothetical protein